MVNISTNMSSEMLQLDLVTVRPVKKYTKIQTYHELNYTEYNWDQTMTKALPLQCSKKLSQNFFSRKKKSTHLT